MVEANQRNMNIDLHIKALIMKVSEHTPVYVMWQRGKYQLSQLMRFGNADQLLVNV